VGDQKCQELAKLHSKAVDFNKTGVPAIMPNGMKEYGSPDFMQKGGYESKKACPRRLFVVLSPLFLSLCLRQNRYWVSFSEKLKLEERH